MRNGQLTRIVATYGVLRGNRFPASLEDINRDVTDRIGERLCLRTTRRDLEALEVLGLAEHEQARWSLIGPLSFFEATYARLSRGGVA